MKKIIYSFFIVFIYTIGNLQGQGAMPFYIENNSNYDDDELYIAIVGQDLSEARAHVWVDLSNGTQKPMNPSYNTINGPVIQGNLGPGQDGKYADCFFKLSEIPNNTVQLAPIQGCRMFIAAKEQLYLYFFGSTGASVGYAAPSHSNPTDPNKDIRYEIIELTYNEIGFWGNTSRVDSYNYPIALELASKDGDTIKTGELMSDSATVANFRASVPTEFQGCYDAKTGQIFQPTKTAAFADGTIGTMPIPGPYKDYMQPYIDAIWSKYSSEDLVFHHPEIGTWKGRVNTNQHFVFTCIGGPAGFIGKTGIIPGKPNTQEAFEGKGVLDNAFQAEPRFDLMMQAQVCAALTRHVIKTNVASGTVQNWGNNADFYQESPCNHYAKFWHQKGVRVNQLAYGFAYDDVYEQSSTLHSPKPASVKVIFGGYYVKETTTPAVRSPYLGTPIVIPGTIEAEYYDNGGQGLAFNDLSTANQGNSTLRSDAVDIEENNNRINIGFIESDEWYTYTIDVAKDTLYDFSFTIATENTDGSLAVLIDEQSIIDFQVVKETNSWFSWDTVTSTKIPLAKGQHLLKVNVLNGGFNLDKIEVTPSQFPTENNENTNNNNSNNNNDETNNNDNTSTDLDGYNAYHLTVYPNPSRDILHIAGGEETPKNWTVIDMQGRSLLQGNSNTIHISTLPEGVYILLIEGTVMQRIPFHKTK